MVGLDPCLYLDCIYYSVSIKVLNLFMVRFRQEINSRAAAATCLLACESSPQLLYRMFRFTSKTFGAPQIGTQERGKGLVFHKKEFASIICWHAWVRGLEKSDRCSSKRTKELAVTEFSGLD